MTEQTIKECIQGIYCETLAFLHDKGFSLDHSRIYASEIARLYAGTVKDLAAVGCLKGESDA